MAKQLRVKRLLEIVEGVFDGSIEHSQVKQEMEKTRLWIACAIGLGAKEIFFTSELECKFSLKTFYNLVDGDGKVLLPKSALLGFHKSVRSKTSPERNGWATTLTPPPELCRLVERLPPDSPGLLANLERIQKVLTC